MKKSYLLILEQWGTYIFNRKRDLDFGNEEIRKAVSNLFSSLSISQNDEIIVGTNSQFVQQVYYSNNRYSLKDYINRDNETFNDYYDSQVKVLYRDISGSVWVGTNRAGLNRIDRKIITYRKYKATNQENESEDIK